MLEVPTGTELVIDLGKGQLAVARVRRLDGPVQGLEFESALISDGADGLHPPPPASRPRFMQGASGGQSRAA